MENPGCYIKNVYHCLDDGCVLSGVNWCMRKGACIVLGLPCDDGGSGGGGSGGGGSGGGGSGGGGDAGGGGELSDGSVSTHLFSFVCSM